MLWQNEILVPQPGIKLTPPVVEVQSLNCWTAWKSPSILLLLTALPSLPE